MTQPLPSFPPLCSICHQPVDLETSKTDNSGQAVHEKCYSAQLAERRLAIEPNPDKSQSI